MTTTLTVPLLYSPACEHLEEDEAETQAALTNAMLDMQKTMFENKGEVLRSVHAKSHGVLRGTLQVLPGLPPALAQGLFAEPRSYDVALRLSSPPAEQLADAVSVPRGAALKVMGVAGPRVAGSEGDTTQDFVMVNGPVFNSANAKAFLGQLKLLAATTDKAPRGKEILSKVLRGTEKVLEAVGMESAALKAMGGHPETHILGETFFTQVPLRHGAYIAKLSLAPVSPELAALKDAKLELDDKPDGLREAVVDFFLLQGGTWELRAQLCVDLETMPVEDASVEWPETVSPYVALATLEIPRQPAWSAESVDTIDAGMAFSPWHALAAHQPLGSVMRARKVVYEASARMRAAHGGRSLAEPRAGDTAPA